MLDDFDTSKHRLQPVRLKNFHGWIFGTFDWEIDSIESYLGGSDVVNQDSRPGHKAP